MSDPRKTPSTPETGEPRREGDGQQTPGGQPNSAQAHTTPTGFLASNNEKAQNGGSRPSTPQTMALSVSVPPPEIWVNSVSLTAGRNSSCSQTSSDSRLQEERMTDWLNEEDPIPLVDATVGAVKQSRTHDNSSLFPSVSGSPDPSAGASPYPQDINIEDDEDK